MTIISNERVERDSLKIPLLSPAQKRAVEWLPSTGEWRGVSDIARELTNIMSVMSESGHVEKREVSAFWNDYRLTPRGIALFHPEIAEGK